MFSNLIYLILALLIISLSGEVDPSTWPLAPSTALAFGAGEFILLLALILFQNIVFKNLSKDFHDFLANLEAILFLIVYQFILGAQRFFETLPLAQHWQIIPTVFSLLFYFAAIHFFYYIYSKTHPAPFSSHTSGQQLRLILPFAIPFLLFTFAIDLLLSNQAIADFFSRPENTLYGALFFFVGTLLFLGLVTIFLPPAAVKIWGCKPMATGPLKERLENFCKKARFQHGGILDWTVLEHSLTAAIMGVLPKLRYILFTKKIQKTLSYDSLEAVLAHEIGHSRHRHLLIYPFIIIGMVFCTALFSLFFNEGITLWFNRHYSQNPSSLWAQLYPLAIFIPYVLIILFYFRYVFGFFSRQFERQADLHGLELGLPAENMVTALDDVAIATGFSHLAPNWHHYSLQDRIDFLRSTIHDPLQIKNHHRKVKKVLFIYFSWLAITFFILISPLLKGYRPFSFVDEGIRWISMQISDLINFA